MNFGKSGAVALALASFLLLGTSTLNNAAAQKKPKNPSKPSAASAKLIAEGKKVYGKNGCNACHSIGGIGGKTGPDLSKVGARRKPDWLTVQIRDPKKNDHDSIMPAYDEEKINAKDLKALVAYLSSLK